MRRAVNIGGVALDNPLFLKESFDVHHVRAKSFVTIGGGLVIHETPKRRNADYMTLTSLETGWLKEETLTALRDLADQIGAEADVTFADGEVQRWRFAHEKPPVIEAEPLYDGSRWYKVKISMCRV